ncbi:type II secretion system protein N [Hydrocarboniphaga effusa]|uniref:type II secretion system protein N n=1 Tax=Hydrocarboniphaga effusa TaxID=243629 RepID=UPI003BA8CCE5
MKKRWPILLGVLVFLYSLVMYAPLAVVYGYLKPEGSTVELRGVAGTLKQGSAAGVVVRGETAVRDLRWTMSVWQLLIGRAAFDFSGSGDGLVLEGHAALPVTGGVRLSDLRASGSVKPLLAALKLFLPIDGQLGLDAQKLVLDNGFPTQAQGSLTLNRLAWKLGREPLMIGDFQAEVVPADEGLAAKIKTLGGPLDASGEAALHADRSYDLHLQIRAKADAPQPLVNMLRTLGAADNQGYYHIRRKGQMESPAVEAVQEVSE